MPRSWLSDASEPTSDYGPSKTKPTPAAAATGADQGPASPEPTQVSSIGPFEPEYGDITLLVKGEALSTHKYLLQRFSKLKDMVTANPSTGRSRLALEDAATVTPDDFRHTFKMLYASSIDGPIEFDASTFKSALRLATHYDYPSLRTYSIKHLEQASLGPIERIQIARECNLPEWEEPAYAELGAREEMITADEAAILGLETYIDISRRRESVLRRAKTATPEPEEIKVTSISLASPKPISVMSNGHVPRTPEPMASSNTSTTEENVIHIQDSLSRPTSKLSIRREAMIKPATPTGIKSKKERAKAFKPCFVNVPPPGIPRTGKIEELDMIELQVADCRCKTFLNPRMDSTSGEWISERHIIPCRLPSCAIQAFKQLQKEQIAYAERVERLEALIEQVTTDQVLVRRATMH